MLFHNIARHLQGIYWLKCYRIFVVLRKIHLKCILYLPLAASGHASIPWKQCAEFFSEGFKTDLVFDPERPGVCIKWDGVADNPTWTITFLFLFQLWFNKGRHTFRLNLSFSRKTWEDLEEHVVPALLLVEVVTLVPLLLLPVRHNHEHLHRHHGHRHQHCHRNHNHHHRRHHGYPFHRHHDHPLHRHIQFTRSIPGC